MDMFIEKSCTSIVERILRDETHPLTQALSNQPLPKQFTRNTQIRITKAKKSRSEPEKASKRQYQNTNPTRFK